MIVVTGANGQLGRAIVERLIERVPAAQIGVSVRDPEKAQPLRERGVRVRRGTFTDAASLRESFEGASRVLLVSSGTTAGDTLSQHGTAIEAARAAGARHIVYTSHMGANEASHFSPMRNHAATEAMLRDSGMTFTSLRNGFYASSALLFMGQALETGQIVLPEDGPVSWTAHGDLADAAVIALTQDDRLDGLTAPLTASAALDMAGIATIASELTGRRITRVTVTDEAYRAGMVARGVPQAVVEISMGMFLASRGREFAAVDPTLERLLGRPLISMRDVLAARLSTSR
jgi:NAD(P)H dehydrogenase (quinone)